MNIIKVVVDIKYMESKGVTFAWHIEQDSDARDSVPTKVVVGAN